MIESAHDLPVKSPGGVAGPLALERVLPAAAGGSDGDLTLMRRIAMKLHLNFPFAGARMLRDMLKLEGFMVGRKHVRTLMDKMGIAAHLPQAQHQRAAPGACGVSVPAQKSDDRAAESGVGNRHHLYPDEARLCLPGGHLDWATRKVLAHRVSTSMTPDFCVEALEEAIAKYRPTRDLQHRPGQPVHERRVHRCAQRSWYPDQHGRQGPMGGQRVRRTAVEEREIRARLPARLRQRARGKATARQLLRVLQHPPPAFIPRRTNARHRIPRQRRVETSSMTLTAGTSPTKSKILS